MFRACFCANEVLEMTTQESSDENQKSEMPKDAKGGLPSGRPGRDIDMAAAVLFCASCQYLNGQNSTFEFTSFCHSSCADEDQFLWMEDILSRLDSRLRHVVVISKTRCSRCVEMIDADA